MKCNGLEIRSFVDPMFGQNSRVVHPEDEKCCWVIDPGLPPATAQLLSYIRDQHLQPAAVMLTHAHADHVAGVPEVCRAYQDIPVYLAEVEWAFLDDPSNNLSQMIGVGLVVQVERLSDLMAGSQLTLGSSCWQVLDTSGHSPGGRSLYCAAHQVVVVGDALFSGSVGRTDFHHSNADQMFRNIRNQLLTLPDDTCVLSGHGPDTTIGEERQNNPFLS
ncbi:MAG: putative metallo-hydrolase [Phycisphaerae bacterium]|nr:putative metallo-hydrolase [Phycisphaerae bacterium]